METALLVFIVLVLVFANFWLVYKTLVKPMRKKTKVIEAPNQFPYSGNSVPDKRK